MLCSVHLTAETSVCRLVYYCRFFPERMQPFVAVLCNSVYALLVTVKLCKKQTKHYEMRPAQSPVIITLPGTEAHDAERRRFTAPAATLAVLFSLCTIIISDCLSFLLRLLTQFICAWISVATAIAAIECMQLALQDLICCYNLLKHRPVNWLHFAIQV